MAQGGSSSSSPLVPSGPPKKGTVQGVSQNTLGSCLGRRSGSWPDTSLTTYAAWCSSWMQQGRRLAIMSWVACFWPTNNTIVEIDPKLSLTFSWAKTQKPMIILVDFFGVKANKRKRVAEFNHHFPHKMSRLFILFTEGLRVRLSPNEIFSVDCRRYYRLIKTHSWKWWQLWLQH